MIKLPPRLLFPGFIFYALISCIGGVAIFHHMGIYGPGMAVGVGLVSAASFFVLFDTNQF